MKILLLMQAIAVEGVGIYLLANPQLALSAWWWPLACHGLACLSFTVWCCLILPKKYCDPLWRTFCALLLFSLLLPVVGIVGMACSILLTGYFPKQHQQYQWQSIEALALPPDPKDLITQTLFGTGALRNILLHHDSPTQRCQAVSAISLLPRQQSVPLLQLALKDVFDDTRLLAYAALESIENSINEQISRYQQRYEQLALADTYPGSMLAADHATAHTATHAATHTATHTPDRAPAHELAYYIAQQYWELCYLGIAEGILKKHYLTQAEQYLRRSLTHTRRGASSLLLGRVLLAQRRAEEALPYLTHALDQGLRLDLVVPYLAEAAYLAKDYGQVRTHIFALADNNNNQLTQLKEYWS
ncbi:MAG: hypothetical protein H9917_01595 [Candidatus Oceanisphaera merdipullorum]|nr:hypothetical protein [Candidatus Oceanisphaera merdipullorum]